MEAVTTYLGPFAFLQMHFNGDPYPRRSFIPKYFQLTSIVCAVSRFNPSPIHAKNGIEQFLRP